MYLINIHVCVNYRFIYYLYISLVVCITDAMRKIGKVSSFRSFMLCGKDFAAACVCKNQAFNPFSKLSIWQK